MSHVTRSASLSIGQVFGAVAATANAVTTTVTAVGNAADVLNLHSNEWLERTRLEIQLAAVQRNTMARDKAQLAFAQHILERESMLTKNPALKLAYDEAGTKFDEFLNQQPQPQ